MRLGERLLTDSAIDSSLAARDLAVELRSLRAIIGDPCQRRSMGGLKRVGMVLLLAPTPEPLSDLVGLAMIGAGVVVDHMRHPMTVSELSSEAGSLFRSILSSSATP